MMAWILVVMLTFREVTVIDVNSEYLGVQVETLMENAGYAVAKAITESYGKGKRIAVICGMGNNGGDGLVAAKYLRESNDVKVLLARPPQFIKRMAPRKNLGPVEDITKVYGGEELSGYDLLVDAIYGIGIHGEIKEPYFSLIGKINRAGVPVVSIDVPSGLGTNMAVRPETTITLHDIKEGMEASNSGRIEVVDIGIPRDAERFAGPGEYVYYPIPRPDSHKGENGRVLVIGGGPYTGAPSLAAMGAFRIGADLVQIATPEPSFPAVSGYSPNLIVHSMPGTVFTGSNLDQVQGLANVVDVVLIGSGLGRDPRTQEAVREFVKECGKPMVIDADAFTALSMDPELLGGKTGIVTPHSREFATLFGKSLPGDLEERGAAIREAASNIGMTVLVKGMIDVISDGDRIKFNRTGNAGMSVGGTGDVLAGICAGLMSKGVRPFDAARMAAFTNGAAGDLAFNDRCYGLLATDVIDNIPAVMCRALDRFK
jgi:ADP-dependent NAD(P)H-hydrate dehydratase / NAD(P)H-hydrate epimerase